MISRIPRLAGWRLAAAALAVTLIAGCSASPSPSFELSDCAHADENNVISLTAEDVAFDFPCIVAPADQAFTIHLNNRDGAEHNVAIYNGSDKATEYLRGDIISFGEFIDYPVDALAAGEYYFDCKVHPDMNGPLFVVAS